MLFKINLSKPLMISCMHGDSMILKLKTLRLSQQSSRLALRSLQINRDDNGILLCHFACYAYPIVPSLITLLVDVGMQHEIGSKESRGGLRVTTRICNLIDSILFSNESFPIPWLPSTIHNLSRFQVNFFNISN